jgi:hypothetical protein
MTIIITGDDAPTKNLERTAIDFMGLSNVKRLSREALEDAFSNGESKEKSAIWITGRSRIELEGELRKYSELDSRRLYKGLPKLILITMHSIGPSHGLGVQVRRIIDRLGYPHSHVINVCCYHEGYQDSLPNLEIQPKELGTPSYQAKIANLKAWIDTTPSYLWSFAVEKEDSDLLREISISLNNHVMCRKQHFYDWLPSTEGANEKIFLENVNQSRSDLSSYSSLLSKKAEGALKRGCKTFEGSIFTPISTAGSRINERETNEETLRIALIGNLWNSPGKNNKSWYELLDEALYAQMKNNPKIEVSWFADPIRAQRILETAKFYHAKCLAWRGFHNDLTNELRRYDLGLVPHSLEEEKTTNYTAYSIPSRMLEYCDAGVVPLAFTSPTTVVHEEIVTADLGFSLTFKEFRENESFLSELANNKQRIQLKRDNLKSYIEKKNGSLEFFTHLFASIA